MVRDRPEIGKEMNNEMLLCDVAVFQKSYLPFVPVKGDVTACVEKLKTAQLLVQDEKGQLEWSSFPKRPTKGKSGKEEPATTEGEEKETQATNAEGKGKEKQATNAKGKEEENKPVQAKKNEKEIFAGIAEIAQQLARCRLSSPVNGQLPVPHIKYRDCPDNNIASEIPGSNNKIDGCFMLNHSSELYSPSKMLTTPNMVVVAEYKKNALDEDELDVRDRALIS